MAEFITAREAAELIPDGAVIGVGGMGLSGFPEEVACAIRDLYRETGHPKNLELHQGSAMGDHGYGNQFVGWDKQRRTENDPKPEGVRGLSRLGEAGPGLVTKWYGAHVMSADALNAQAAKGEITGNCLPQGVAVNLWREIAAGRPGLLTKVGLGTFVDPRLEGGRMNEQTKENVAELVEFGGEEYLFYRSFPLNVALLRGTVADEKGNISFMHEGIINEGLAIASAAHNSGGIVIVQVEYLAKADSLNPKDVKIPGILVDYVVQSTDPMAAWQAEGVYWEPSFSGQIRKPVAAIERYPLDERKVIARRCAMEVQAGCVLNLGVGISANVGNILAEEGCLDMVTMCSESGMIGGVPCPLPNFGSSYNPEATIDHNSSFDIIDGGGLDMTCLGLGECDEAGNINVSKFGKRLIGPGGFIDITNATKKVVFCGTFTGKSKLAVKDGRLEILEEGSVRKFKQHVQQVTFSGRYVKPDQRVIYVTERCVFELLDGKMVLTETAPGVDLQKDILDQMDFVPEISADLKQMDEGLFREDWGGLRKILTEGENA
ncbi:MAG: acyl CoA:acetate/3-ketoacid CoA transferase [Erysipelotrichaceae bacterium]|nr:acyl CoA:acetate/3-ketoacid CoA transferase [Erysipelotrichaceae bacterium]